MCQGTVEGATRGGVDNPKHTTPLPQSTYLHSSPNTNSRPTSQQQEIGPNAEEAHAAQLGATKVGTKRAKHIISREDNTQEDIGDKDQVVQPHHGSNRNLRVPQVGVTPIQ